MPTVSETGIKGFAHCRNPLCRGYLQEQVEAVRRETGYSYVERGGDLPFMESSTVHIVFADEQSDSPCPYCKEAREVTDQQRPVYEKMTGFAQDGLLHAPRFGEFQPGSEENDQLKQQLADQAKALEAMQAQLAKLAGGDGGE